MQHPPKHISLISLLDLDLRLTRASQAEWSE